MDAGNGSFQRLVGQTPTDLDMVTTSAFLVHGLDQVATSSLQLDRCRLLVWLTRPFHATNAGVGHPLCGGDELTGRSGVIAGQPQLGIVIGGDPEDILTIKRRDQEAPHTLDVLVTPVVR